VANTANFAGNVIAGNITSNNTITANSFSGNGNALSNITGANVVGNVPSAVLANFANFAGNVTVAAQPNITSVGTLTGLTIAGNIIPDADEVYDLGNATHKFRDLWLSGATLRLGNANLSANGSNLVMNNLTTNTLSASNLTVTGTANFANITADVVTANAFVGNGNSLSNITGANVTGNVTSAITANFANFAGNVTEAAQANITSVGTLTGLTVVGTSDLGANGNVKIAGGTTGQLLSTDGSGNLIWTTVSTSGASNGTSGTQVNASNVTTVVDGNTIQTIDANGTTTTGNANVSGNVNASYFVGNGSQLTDITGSNIVGNVTSAVTANFANYAGNVTEAAQANITSVGTLTGLTVAGIADLGPNSNVRIAGGTTGQLLSTDGSGNLIWTTVSTSGASSS
jgi:hypothetical protein